MRLSTVVQGCATAATLVTTTAIAPSVLKQCCLEQSIPELTCSKGLWTLMDKGSPHAEEIARNSVDVSFFNETVVVSYFHCINKGGEVNVTAIRECCENAIG